MSEEATPGEKLTHKQRLFVEYYCGISNGNATDAARRAGYSDPNAHAHRMAVNGGIQTAIRQRYSEAAMDAKECLARLGAQARATLADVTELIPVYEERDGKSCPWPRKVTRYLLDLDWKKLHETGLIHQVAEIKWTQHGPSIKLHDVQGALLAIANAHGLNKAQVEFSGDIGVTVREYPEGL